jgi:hypothetical protein
MVCTRNDPAVAQRKSKEMDTARARFCLPALSASDVLRAFALAQTQPVGSAERRRRLRTILDRDVSIARESLSTSGADIFSDLTNVE